MKTISGALSTFRQAGNAAVIVGLYTFKTVTGTYLRYTDGDAAVKWGGNTFSVGPAIRRTALAWRAGLQVDECTVTLSPTSSDMIGSTPLRLALMRGDLDGAAARIEKAYFDPAALAAPLDVVVAMVGRVAAVRGLVQFDVTVKSLLSLLDQPFPRQVYQPACANVLFDDRCRLASTPYRVTGVVAGVSDPSFTTGLTQADHYFRFGTLKWLTGFNASRTFLVLAHAHVGGTLTLARPTPSPIAIGDTFEIFPGCDRTLATCESKFSNRANFAGQPFIPAPETAL